MEYGTNRGGKERKHYLESQRLINCGYCPYHKGENRRRRPMKDKYKNKSRERIIELIEEDKDVGYE